LVSAEEKDKDKGRVSRLNRLGQWLADHSTHLKVLCRILIVSTAVAVLALGLFSLKTRPAAEAFTRVGGATDVETAVDASRFWLTRPQLIVETSADAPAQLMLGAAHCAMVNHAPLLFTSTDRELRRLVQATTYSWWHNAAKSHITTITYESQVENCLARNDASKHSVKVTGLSVLKAPSQQRQLRWLHLQLPAPLQLRLPPRPMLAKFVVFAAPFATADEPDVAVGLAVAEHLAQADSEKVSLVVIPRYLEADPQLENLLLGQSQTITGGIVLGQTPTVPDDTSALLRQLLTSPDLLSRVMSFLTDDGGLAVALLSLLGLLAVAPQIGGLAVLMIDRREFNRDRQRQNPRFWPQKGKEPPVDEKPEPPPPPPGASELDGQPVTVWLRSGRMVTGVAKGLQNAPVVQGADIVLTVLRLADAKVASRDDATLQGAGSVLIPVAAIDVIGVRESSTPDSSSTTQSHEPVIPPAAAEAEGTSSSSTGAEGSSSTGSRRLRLKPTR
jgi:hypothetical protein